MAGSGYDFNAISFSPEGNLLQVSYACKAVQMGDLSIGVLCKDGILFASEKHVPSILIEIDSVRKIYPLDVHLGFLPVGYDPDCKKLAYDLRRNADLHRSFCGLEKGSHSTVSDLAVSYMVCHIQGGLRPYGCSTMVGSSRDHVLYGVNPYGNFDSFSLICYGRLSDIARNELAELNLSERTIEETIPVVTEIIKGLHNKKNKIWKIDIGYMSEATGHRLKMLPSVVPEDSIANAQ